MLLKTDMKDGAIKGKKIGPRLFLLWFVKDNLAIKKKKNPRTPMDSIICTWFRADLWDKWKICLN